MSKVVHLHEWLEGAETPPPPKGAQVENGYTRIANEILEAAMRAPLTSREGRVFHAVLRATFGWQRPTARLTQQALAKMTGLTPKRCSETLSSLLRKRVLIREGSGRAPVGINTRVSEWTFETDTARVTPKRRPPSKRGQRPQNGVIERPQDGDTNKERKETPTPDGVGDAPSRRRRPLNLKPFVDQVKQETLQAFVEHRQALRAPLTQRALELTVMAATKAAEELGITAEQALDEAIAAGWRTVRTDWLRNRGAVSQGAASEAPPCPHQEILAAWDEVLGDAKGRAPSAVDWRGTKACALLEARWRENFNACNASGTVRYTDIETGVTWWRLAFETLRGKPNFLRSDVDLFNLFHKETFVRAAQGKLREQGGPTR